MIKNEKQYKITKSRLKDFENSLKICKEDKYPDKILQKAMEDGIQSKIDDFKREIQEYEKLRDKKVNQLKLTSFRDLPEILVQSRIAHGYNQKQFAKMLKMPEQQIQRYEIENYRRVSFETLMRICEKLNVDVTGGTKVKIAP